MAIPSDSERVYEAVVAGHGALALPAQRRREVFLSLYWPVFAFLIDQRAQKRTEGPFFVGISAPQGCGKTTMVSLLSDMFSYCGLPCLSMSLDDFYLTGQEQEALARAHPANSILKCRGNAGTHDVKLFSQTLDHLRRGLPCALPRYDKSLRNGRGDRLPESQWPRVSDEVAVVLVEGWMLGFTALPEPESSSLPTDLQEINSFLRSYRSIHCEMDCWVVLAVQEVDSVYQWRLEAEQAMRRQRGSGMTDEEVHRFVDRYMPAYRCYLPSLYSTGPERKEGASTLQIWIDRERQPTEPS